MCKPSPSEKMGSLSQSLLHPAQLRTEPAGQVVAEGSMHPRLLGALFSRSKWLTCEGMKPADRLKFSWDHKEDGSTKVVGCLRLQADYVPDLCQKCRSR